MCLMNTCYKGVHIITFRDVLLLQIDPKSNKIPKYNYQSTLVTNSQINIKHITYIFKRSVEKMQGGRMSGNRSFKDIKLEKVCTAYCSR